MDPLNKEQRRRNMQAIRSKDTSIEIMLRKALWKNRIHYRKNYKALVGTPDIAITKYKIAIFCDSEFWHGYNWEEKRQRFPETDNIGLTRSRKIWQEILTQTGYLCKMAGLFSGSGARTSSCLEQIFSAIQQRERERDTHGKIL